MEVVLNGWRHISIQQNYLLENLTARSKGSVYVVSPPNFPVLYLGRHLKVFYGDRKFKRLYISHSGKKHVFEGKLDVPRSVPAFSVEQNF